MSFRRGVTLPESSLARLLRGCGETSTIGKKLVGETTLSHIRIHRVSVNDDYDFIPKRKKGKKHVHVVLKNDQLLPRNEKVGAWRPVESSWLHRPPFDHSLRSFCWAFWGCHFFFVGSVFPAWVIVIWMKKQNLEDLFVRWFFIHILMIHHINSISPHTPCMIQAVRCANLASEAEKGQGQQTDP